jgi:hypothetical protein
VLADYGPEEALNESADIEWVNMVIILLCWWIIARMNRYCCSRVQRSEAQDEALPLCHFAHSVSYMDSWDWSQALVVPARLQDTIICMCACTDTIHISCVSSVVGRFWVMCMIDCNFATLSKGIAMTVVYQNNHFFCR